MSAVPHDLDMAANLADPGRRAHEIIVAYLKERGCADVESKAFYSPAEWRTKGHEYGTRSHLVVAYDGAPALRPVFNMDAAYDLDCAVYQETGKTRAPYALYEGMQEKLREAGLYFEECTRYYSAIYSIDSTSSEEEEALAEEAAP